MTKAVCDLLIHVDSGILSLPLSLDISAAFDTLNHERSLQRAKDLSGFMDSANSWLASYVFNRSIFVSIGATSLALLFTVLVLHRDLF
jgi:hypothetical protein